MFLVREGLNKIVLTPISRIWEKAYSIRRDCYSLGVFSSKALAPLTISVGNLAFGGSGKTPLTIWLSKYAESLGLKPVVLTRGYKGKLENSHGILQANKKFEFDPILFGDEPVIIARKMDSGCVVVGKKRLKNYEFYFEHKRPDLVILDDGFQHLSIERDLNFVLFDSTLPISRLKVAPLGYLREGMSALDRADIIFLSKSDQVSDFKLESLQKIIREYSSAPILKFNYRADAFYDSKFNYIGGSDFFREKKAIFLAAIASPQSFFTTLEDLGVRPVEQIVFPDHHKFSKIDVEKIERKAQELDCPVVVSEKDMVKLRRLTRTDCFKYLSVEIEFIDEGELILKKTIKEGLSDKKSI